MNLVNLAMKYAGPMVAERIATKMGIGGPLANKLIAAALPMIMGSLIGKSNSSSGLSSIMDLVTGANKPDPKALEFQFDQGGDIDALAQSGGGMLEGLLGGQGMTAITGALGRYAGVDAKQAGALLGMMAPAALGTVSGVVSEQNMDGAGLASFLSGQKANVAQAMPASLASELSGNDMFAGMSGAFGKGAAAVADVKQASSKMPLILGAVAVAAAAWFFLGRDSAPEMPTEMSSAQEFVVGDVNVGEQFGSITGSLSEAFTGITDTASAQAALPQLTELTGQIGSLSETAGQLTGPAKTGFQSIVAAGIGQLRPIIEGAIESSGAGAILQPIADQLLAALEGMAG